MRSDKRKTTFKEVQRKNDKISDLQSQFIGLNIRGEDNSDEEDMQQKSQHENLIYQYLNRTKLEQALLTGIKAAISGDTIPKNPWCEVGRALGNTNLRMDLFNNFEKIVKQFRKTPVGSPGPFGICQVTYNYKEKIRELNEDNVYEEKLIDRAFSVLGYEKILEYVFLPKLKDFYDAIQNIIPEFTRDFQNCTLQVVNSLSGGYILQSQLVQYPNAHPKDLEIFCECFVETYSYEVGLDAFANFVYEDCVAIQNKKDMHLIKEFIVYKFDEGSKKQIKISWTMKWIRQNKNRFLQEVIAYTKEKKLMYWKGYCRVKLFENDDLAVTMEDVKGVNRLLRKNDSNNPDNIAYQYVKTYKYYNLHCNIANEQQSFAHQPLGSLVKGVFFDLNQAQRYAGYFYQKNEEFSKTQHFIKFIQNQLKLVLKKWVDQNIGACSWELIYIVLYLESADMRRNLMDSIVQIISSDYSGLVACTKFNNILRMLLSFYWENKIEQVKPSLFTVYNIFKEQMYQIFGRSSGADIIRYRDFIFRLFREMEDNQGGFLIDDKNQLILKQILKITKFMSNGNLQRIAGVTRNLPQFIFEALNKNNLINENDKYFTFDQFSELKVPKKMMHVSQEVISEKKSNKSGLRNEQDIEDTIILQFLNEYDLFDNLYYILRDIFFGKQIPNALPTVQFRVETMSLKYQLFEITREEVRSQMCNAWNNDLLVDVKDPTKKLYAYKNEEMMQLEMKPIFGLEEVIYYTSVFEVSGLKMFLDSFNWTKAIKKGFPPSYQVQPILSISTYNLFQDATILNRTYCEWNINWDWIIKGASYQHAQQIFSDTILKYVSWLELSTDCVVMGFYIKKNPREPFLTVEEILEAQDLQKMREQLLKGYTDGSRVYFKIIFKVESRFKCVNYLINLHYIDPIQPNPQSLLKQDLPDTYIKIFFEKNDFILWNRLYPFNKNLALKLLIKEQKELFYQGNLNNTMKLELIKFYLTESEEFFLTMCRVLFSYSESFYNYTCEANLFVCLLNYLQRSLINQKNKKKIYLADIQPFFNEFKTALIDDLLSYDNVYFDSIGATILNNIQYVTTAFQGTQEYSTYENAMIKLSDMCQVISDSVILTFRQLMLEDYGYTLLWVAK